jgi:hypothetical protein
MAVRERNRLQDELEWQGWGRPMRPAANVYLGGDLTARWRQDVQADCPATRARQAVLVRHRVQYRNALAAKGSPSERPERSERSKRS